MPSDKPTLPLTTPQRTRSCAQNCGAQVTELRRMIGGFSVWDGPWDGPDCPTCAEKLLKAAHDEQDARRVADNRTRLVEMLGGPQPLKECTIEIAKATFAADKKEAVLSASGFNPLMHNLYFFGPVGTGKSHLAMAIAIDQCNRGRSVAYFTPRSLNREFRRFQLDAEKEKKFLKSLWMVDVFVLDELGIGNATEFALESLQEIIDGRRKNYRNGAVFTSNLDLDQLAKAWLSNRISDRLFGNCKQVFLGGESFRGNVK